MYDLLLPPDIIGLRISHREILPKAGDIIDTEDMGHGCDIQLKGQKSKKDKFWSKIPKKAEVYQQLSRAKDVDNAHNIRLEYVL